MKSANALLVRFLARLATLLGTGGIRAVLVEETLPMIRRVIGDANVSAFKLLMGSEDFSFYQKVVPGFFYFLGVGNPAKGITAGWHTAEFDVDEACLGVGVKVMANVLVDLVDYWERHASDR